jgi:outer membrane protein assembly factor BamB
VIRRIAVLVALASAAPACGHRLATHAAEHGNLVEHATDEASEPRGHETALVILIEDHRVRAIDPRSARTVWSRAMQVTGHPVANTTTIYFPVRDHRLVAVDRQKGTVQFTVELAGEALTGLAASSQWVVATVLGGSKGARAQLVAMTAHEGHVRWHHEADAPLGVPAIAGPVVVVPSGRQVAAFRLRGGREVARQTVHSDTPLERAVLSGRSWLVGGGTTWHELGAGGKARQVAGIDAPIFPPVAGFDPGHDDGERLRVWLGWSREGAARDAIMLGRRAVIAFRFDGEGRPGQARWVHTERGRELVAMQVLGDDVVLVAEDGAIAVLHADTGEIRDRIAGGDHVRGALVLGPAALRPSSGHAQDVDAALAELLVDPDPRLLPAQRLAADLLWRSDDASVRAAVLALAAGRTRPETTEAAEALRDHAATLASRHWGNGSSDDVRALVAAIERRPDRTAPTEAELAERSSAIRGAARIGSPEVVRALTELLLDPNTPPFELVEVVQTLDEIGDPAAVVAVARFVRRYHADQAVAYESPALQGAAQLLLHHAAGEDADAASVARDALESAARDPLCEPALRAFISRGLSTLAVAPDARTPPLLSSRL